MPGESQLAALARGSRRLAPLLLGIIAAELWRWVRMRWAKRCQAATPSQKPPRWPGVDDDHRLQQIQDDPRYLPGAGLGKAQRAAKGIHVPAGTNTVSFDPASTLVEPGLRCICGPKSPVFTGAVRPEDLVVTPEFFSAPTDMQTYDGLRAELQDMAAKQSDLCQAVLYRQLLARIQEYFRMDTDTCVGCLTWHEKSGDPVLIVKDPGFDAAQSSGKHESVVHAVFGGSCELRMQRAGQKEYVAIPCQNGALQLVGSAALARWRCERAVLQSWEHGLVSLTVLGNLWGMPRRRRRFSTVKPNPVPLDIKLGDPLHRPAMRIRATCQDVRDLGRISHDDVIVVPEFFGAADDWDAYYELLREIREGQARGVDQSQWESWHEGAHLLTKNPAHSKTFNAVLDQICEQFDIANGHLRDSVGRDALGMRFNWYRDGSDWKPFHHDSAAFNPRMAAKQNCTVGVSLGSQRELAFRSAASSDLIYFPQTNGMLFFFGRDVNIRWQHGVNALPLEEQSGKGRISIILWGRCQLAVEEVASPAMLPMQESKPNASKTTACRDFQRGTCKYGGRCKFSHSGG